MVFDSVLKRQYPVRFFDLINTDFSQFAYRVGTVALAFRDDVLKQTEFHRDIEENLSDIFFRRLYSCVYHGFQRGSQHLAVVLRVEPCQIERQRVSNQLAA